VCCHDMADDGKAQPGPVAAGFVHLEKAFKNTREISRRDARAVIVHGDNHLVVLAGCRNLNEAPRLGKLDGVVDEILDGAARVMVIGQHQDRLWHFDRDGLLLIFGQRQKRINPGIHDTAQFRGHQANGHLAGFDQRQVTDFLHKLGEGVYFALNVFRHFAASFGLLFDGRVQQRFGQQTDRGDRGAEFVGDVRHHLTARPLEALNFGDIAQRQHLVGAAVRFVDHCSRVENMMIKLYPAFDNFAPDHLRILKQRFQVGLVNDVEQVLIEQGLAERTLGRGISEKHALLRVQDE